MPDQSQAPPTTSGAQRLEPRLWLLLWPLLVLVIVTQAFIELQVVYGRLNVPVADLAALIICLVFGIGLLRNTPLTRLFGVTRFVPAGTSSPPERPLPLPVPLLYCLFLGSGLLALVNSQWVAECAYFLVRKPLFNYVVYGVGLAAIVAQIGQVKRLFGVVLAFAALASGICIVAAIPLWLLGYAPSNLPIPWLTINHKTLAVALAPYLPFIWMGRRQVGPTLDRYARLTFMLALVAVVLSVSKTAWITTVFGLIGLVRWPGSSSPRLIERTGWMAAGVLVVLALMVALPFLLGSALMADAFDSRMSLNLRAWEMFREHPLLGFGPGSSTLYMMNSAPHYRINGVDAHGVIQKVAAEQGLLGLGLYLAFTAALLRGLWRTAFAPGAHPDPLMVGAALMGIALHVNLLLSTEYFTSSHWVPLGIALGLATLARKTGRAGAGSVT